MTHDYKRHGTTTLFAAMNTLNGKVISCCAQRHRYIDLAKKDSAIRWCANASDHAATYDGKPWRYVLIPHDEIAENITLAGLVARFGGRM